MKNSQQALKSIFELKRLKPSLLNLVAKTLPTFWLAMKASQLVAVTYYSATDFRAV